MNQFDCYATLKPGFLKFVVHAQPCLLDGGHSFFQIYGLNLGGLARHA